MVANKRLSVGCVSSGRWSSLNCPLAVTLWKRRISLLHLRFQDEEEEPRETFPVLAHELLCPLGRASSRI